MPIEISKDKASVKLTSHGLHKILAAYTEVQFMHSEIENASTYLLEEGRIADLEQLAYQKATLRQCENLLAAIRDFGMEVIEI